jgi:hypothetical protein
MIPFPVASYPTWLFLIHKRLSEIDYLGKIAFRLTLAHDTRSFCLDSKNILHTLTTPSSM